MLWHAVAKPGDDKRGRAIAQLKKPALRPLLPASVPLDYMLSVMRDSAADIRRRDAMAMAAAPYLHPRLTAVDAKLSPAAAQPSPQKLLVRFVLPTRDHAREDRE